MMSIKGLHRSLGLYGEVSGYKINLAKSSLIAWNVNQEEQSKITQIFQVPGKQQVKYLGVQLTTTIEEGNLIYLNITPLIAERNFWNFGKC